jgi:hypothetical protein
VCATREVKLRRTGSTPPVPSYDRTNVSRKCATPSDQSIKTEATPRLSFERARPFRALFSFVAAIQNVRVRQAWY